LLLDWNFVLEPKLTEVVIFYFAQSYHAADQLVQILDHCIGESEHFELSLICWEFLPFRLLHVISHVFFVFESWKVQGLSGYLYIYYYLLTNLVS